MACSRFERGLDRIIDANANRAGEGLRAVEDVFRFVFCKSSLSKSFRNARHELARLVSRTSSRRALLEARDSVRDVGARAWREGLPRTGLSDLVTANLRRAQESARVLEEIARMKGNAGAARGFQALRFRLYGLEKGISGVISKRMGRAGGGKGR